MTTIYSREVAFVTRLLDPINIGQELPSLDGLNDHDLMKVLKANKLLTKFIKKLGSDEALQQEFFRKYPTLQKPLAEVYQTQTTDLAEFVRISQILSDREVRLLLIKSEGTFPHESSNFDCLVPPDKVGVTARVLQGEGYQEMPLAREPHKYLFRKMAKPKELPLHIHTRVEWEAIEFAEAQNLRNRSRPLQNVECGALTPSIEDSILITIAHYFFEDHEIKLYDLLKLWNLLSQGNIDWQYIYREADRLSWNDALSLNVNLLNRMSNRYYSTDLITKYPHMQAGQVSMFNKAITFGSQGQLKVPYFVSALFFLRKVQRNPQFMWPQKSRQIIYVFSDILRRISIGYMEP